MPSASYHRSISAAPARALFASPLHRSSEPGTRHAHQAIATTTGAYGVRGGPGRAGLRQTIARPKLPTASMPLIGVISAAEATVMPSVVFTAPYGSDRHSSRAFLLLWLSFGRAGGQLPQRSGEEAGPGPRGRAR
jgi:hypothetical protein